jgi:hypothetical protein
VGGACKAGRCQRRKLAAEPAPVTAIAVDDHDVFWATDSTNDPSVLRRVPLDGGKVVEVAKLELPLRHALARDGVLYGCDQGGVVRVDGKGVVKRIFAGTERCLMLAADDAHLYSFGEDGIVRAHPFSGGEPTFVAERPSYMTTRIAIFGGYLYTNDEEGIGRVRLAGGALERIAKIEQATDVAVDAMNVYYLHGYVRDPAGAADGGDYSHLAYAITAQPLGGGAPRRLATRLLEGGGLVADGESLYFSMGGAYGAPVELQRIHVAKGEVERVDDGSPGAFAVGVRVIAWSDGEAHEIRALAK